MIFDVCGWIMIALYTYIYIYGCGRGLSAESPVPSCSFPINSMLPTHLHSINSIKPRDQHSHQKFQPFEGSPQEFDRGNAQKSSDKGCVCSAVSKKQCPNTSTCPMILIASHATAAFEFLHIVESGEIRHIISHIIMSHHVTSLVTWKSTF